MSNEVTTPKQTGLGALGALRTGLQNVRTKLPEVGGSPYLRLLKDGDWVFGQEDNAVAKGTEAVINPLSIKHGYSCWTNRQPGQGKNESMGEIMVGLNQPLQMIHELPQHSDPTTGNTCPWKDQMALDLKFVSGKHKGTQVQWKVSSVGGLNAARVILDAVLAKLDEGTAFVCPIVSLDSDSYKHATYGKTYVPKIEVVGWMDLEGNEEDGEDDGAPADVVQKLAAPEPEPVVAPADEEAPRRRRRV
jgi:hypothetical protein